MLWLRADLERPSCCAAAVKLPQQARSDAVFYEIYAEADKHRDPGKRHTGIFMFKGGDNAPLCHDCGGWRFCLRRLAARGLPHRQARGGTGL